jgi:4-hydroxy-3-methylbut-2-enyl diphosphate reductase
MEKVCVVSQSTQFPDSYDAIITAVRRRFPGAVALATICAATRNRQAELVRIAKKTEALVIVGDKKSANTLRLVKLARTLNPTFFIQTAAQIRPARLRLFRCIGLTAGASTPNFVIEAVRNKLKAIPPDSVCNIRKEIT